MVAKTDYVRARINPELKHSVESILDQLGLNTTDAITMYYKMILLHKGLPFEIKIPNDITNKVFVATDNRQELHAAKDLGDLFKQLEEE